MGINCNLTLHCRSDDSLLPSSKSILNPEITTSGLLSSNDVCYTLPPRNTLDIDNLETSNKNEISISMKQRHLSSTPLVPIDSHSASNEIVTENINITKQKTPFPSKVTLLDQHGMIGKERNVHNFEDPKRSIQIKYGGQQIRTKKFNKLEKELELVKSSWDSEVRFIRYNMETLRNEIESNANFISKQDSS